MKIIEGIPCWGEQEPAVIAQMKAIMDFSIPPAHVALMADAHVGYSVPVGGVVAYEKAINVNGVGYDIACGNKAVRLDSPATEVRENIYRTMNEINKHISFGVGRKNNEPVDDPLFDDPVWNTIGILRHLKDKARSQLGTVGSGNHYVDIFIDDLDRVWCGVHFGSRGLGHSIATHFVRAAGGKDGVHADPVILNVDSDLGSQYLTCMELAGKYAYAGRDWVCQRVATILRASIVEHIHNHHNFAWLENHNGRDLWVVRKGATPAFPGQKGFVGGSMGDISVILEGRPTTSESGLSLSSTIHGAGRKLGRTEAKGKFNRRTGECLKVGKVNPEEHKLRCEGIEIRGGDLDESPLAYKDIIQVLAAHKETVKVLHVLKPIGVVMADNRTCDPYKD